MNIGYIRVSSEQQDVSNQELEIRRYAESIDLNINQYIKIEVSSRKSLKDRQIDKLMELSLNDNLLVSEISRLGRSTREILSILDELKNKGVAIHLIKQNLIVDKNSNDIMNKLLLTVISAFAELERDLISQRTKEALKSKRESGVVLGRPKGSTSKSKLDGKEEEIKRLLTLKVPKTSIAKILGCDRSTLNNFIKSRNV